MFDYKKAERIVEKLALSDGDISILTYEEQRHLVALLDTLDEPCQLIQCCWDGEPTSEVEARDMATMWDDIAKFLNENKK